MFHRFFEPDLYESPSFGFPEQFHILIPYVGFRLLVDGHATRDAETLPDTGAYGFVFRGPVNRKPHGGVSCFMASLSPMEARFRSSCSHDQLV